MVDQYDTTLLTSIAGVWTEMDDETTYTVGQGWVQLNPVVIFGVATGGGTIPPDPTDPDPEKTKRAAYTAAIITGQPGARFPDATWTGVTDVTKLVPGPNPGGTWTITTPGVYENLDLTCNIRVTTTGQVTLRNCRIRGYNKTWTSQSAWVVNASGGQQNLLMEDCLIDPDYPTPWANGYSGPDVLMRRVRIRRTTDGAGQFTRNGDNRARFEACLFERMSYFTPDPPNSNRANTHNDPGAQIFQGTGVTFLGCSIIGLASLDSGTPQYGIGTGAGKNTSYPATNGNGFALTPTLSGNITGIVIRYNFIDGNEAGISIVKHIANGQTQAGHDIAFNVFGPNMGTKNAGRPVPIQMSQGLILPGFDASTDGWKTDTRGNIFQATGDPIQYLVRSGKGWTTT